MATSTPVPFTITLDFLSMLLSPTVTPAMTDNNGTQYETWQLILAVSILVLSGLCLSTCGLIKYCCSLINSRQQTARSDESRGPGLVRNSINFRDMV